jgi:hypothetical protein
VFCAIPCVRTRFWQAGGKSGVELVGGLDDPKLRSCVKLFEKVSRGGFDAQINDVCQRTLRALKEEGLEGYTDNRAAVGAGIGAARPTRPSKCVAL